MINNEITSWNAASRIGDKGDKHGDSDERQSANLG